MTLLQLEYFTEVVRRKNFTKAAEALHVSQSTLSKSIRALEDEFQLELIDRSSKDFRLSGAGEIFFDYAQQLRDFHQMKTRELYQRLRDREDSLHIGIPPTAGTVLFNKVLYRFQTENPRVNLVVDDSQASKSVLERLEAGKLDMGVLLGNFSNPNYHTYEALRSEVMLAVSPQHPLASRESVSFAELKDESFLMFSPEYMFHDALLSRCHAAGFEPHVAMYSYQWDLIHDLTVANKGISFFPPDLLTKAGRSQLRLIHLTEPEFPWVLTVAYRKDKYITPAMRQFLKICKEEK